MIFNGIRWQTKCERSAEFWRNKDGGTKGQNEMTMKFVLVPLLLWALLSLLVMPASATKATTAWCMISNCGMNFGSIFIAARICFDECTTKFVLVQSNNFWGTILATTTSTTSSSSSATTKATTWCTSTSCSVSTTKATTASWRYELFWAAKGRRNSYLYYFGYYHPLLLLVPLLLKKQQQQHSNTSTMIVTHIIAYYANFNS